MADTKLKIESFAEIDCSGSPIGTYTVKYNPSKFSQNILVDYNNLQAIGSSGTENKYYKTIPETISFDLIFDGTILKKDETYVVSDEIEKFKNIVVTYNGDIHRPNFLKLSWGKFVFLGQLKSLSFAYKLFNPEGEPLRVSADVVFVQAKADSVRLAEEKKSSPDLTHIYIVKEGDSLPLLAEKIYGNPLYYLEIARANHLDNFRTLQAGERLVLPPLEK
jgi:LysM repeat protein